MDADGDHESEQPNSLSGLPDGCSVKSLHKIPPQQGCKFLNDNDVALQYSHGWIVNSSDSVDVSHVHTVHFAPNPGALVSLTFQASRVNVFGLVPAGSSPPQASYAIDNLAPAFPQLSATTTCISTQHLFDSDTLVDTGRPHNLTIIVKQASVEQPYILDHLWLCAPSAKAVQNPNGTTGSESSPGIVNGTETGPSGHVGGTGNGSGNATPPASVQQLSTKDVVIISLASVLGLAIVLCLTYIIWKRRRSKTLNSKLKLQTQTDASLYSDGLRAASISASGLQGALHTDTTASMSALEEGNARPPSYTTSGFTAGNERRLSYSSLLQALTASSITPSPGPTSEKDTLSHSVVPSLRRAASSLNPRQQLEEDDTMGSDASEDDEPPPTYISH